MTQEDKDLLLKDLCARQPYKVKISVDDDYDLFIPRLKFIDGLVCYFYECAWGKFVDQIKPYLRPMSSMTKEEMEEYNGLLYGICDFTQDTNSLTPVIKLTTFFYSHHLDCCELIEKGLAIPAPEGMYK